ncbi:tail tape measure protein [Parerythrobacter lacustris]|uniref:Tail tape measure protein n=1 Tax=Parerythrobacter lacustris TaxID=2969984 RepID=A0ABT1XRH5_9SPHN|nr:tail tape measure protein [Parerythrobacter lacustris]MCR2834263.1 tail tape measure protein [Parerythrobacter lacustris]
MDDNIDELLVEVRASTAGFATDVAQMRSTFDATLLDGFGKAGDILERGLLSAIRKGSLGFEDLKRIATQVLDQIAAQALQMGLDKIFAGSSDGGMGGFLGDILGGVFGLPGRATGGPVSPGRGYLVGERGPELFVPTIAGRVEASPVGSARNDVRVSIQLAAPRGESAPRSLQRSSRQVASAIRRALSTY